MIKKMGQNSKNTAFNLSFSGRKRLVYFILCAPKTFSHYFEMYFIIKISVVMLPRALVSIFEKGSIFKLKKIFC